jgi:hypothetical protein
MSIAAAQASKFYEQVVAEGRVFTFADADSFLVFPVHGVDVVPFWSSRSRLRAVRKSHPKYRAFTEDEIALERFLSDTLTLLEQENIRVGVNWSGKRLVGYDITPTDLRRNLAHWQARAKPTRQRRPTRR